MSKELRRIVLTCAGVLAMGLAAGPVRADSLSGIVQSVDVDGKKATILDQQTSQDVNVGFNDRTEIVTSDGKPLQLSDLKRGDGVGLTHAGGLASRVVVRQAGLKGVVSSINLKDQKLMVIEDVTHREIEVELNPRTRIETPKRQSLALKEIKTGDGIDVLYSGAAPVTVRINSKPPELTGHIKSIGADMRTLVVTEIGNNTDVTVSVTPKTTIVSNSGKTLGMNDLKKGDGVGIAHQSSVASLIVVNPVTAP